MPPVKNHSPMQSYPNNIDRSWAVQHPITSQEKRPLKSTRLVLSIMHFQPDEI